MIKKERIPNMYKKITKEKVKEKIKNIEESKKLVFSIEELVDLRILTNKCIAAHLRERNSGPEFFKKAGRVFYNKKSILDWLNKIKNLYFKKRNRTVGSFDINKSLETKEDIQKKIDCINSQKEEDFTIQELINLKIFYTYGHAKWLRKKGILKGYKFKNIKTFFYLYKKYSILTWLNNNLQEKDIITYENSNSYPLEQSACKDYLKKLNCIEIQLLECIHLFKNIFIQENRI